MVVLYLLSLIVCGALGGYLAGMDGMNHTLGILIGVVFNLPGIVALLVVRFAEILAAGFMSAADRTRQSLSRRAA